MQITKLPIHEILVEDRQRKDLGDIEDLATSIKRFGLIQPIIINQDKRLIAGGRRLAAALLAGVKEIAVTFRETMSTDELHELELEENVRRKDMSWQEHVCCIKTIHDLKKRRAAIDGTAWGQRETAECLGIKGVSNVNVALRVAEYIQKGDAEVIACGSLFEATQRLIDRDVKRMEAFFAGQLGANKGPSLSISSAQAEPELGGCIEAMGEKRLREYSAKDAVDPATIKIDDREHVMALRERAKGLGYLDLNEQEARTLYFSNPLNSPEEFDSYYKERRQFCSDLERDQRTFKLSSWLFNTDCITLMLKSPEQFDHIITDSPYGIDVEMMNQNCGAVANIESVAEEHDVGRNLELMTQFFPAAFHCLKPNAFCITWCDAWNFRFLADKAEKAGFSVQRWPFHWIKPVGDSRCTNTCARINFTKRTEIALIARKGVATLTEVNLPNYVIANNFDDIVNQVNHPFAKPFAAWAPLIKGCTLEGQVILEPFAGGGSGVLSLLQLHRGVIGCELVEEHYNHLIENVKQHFLNTIPNAIFT